MWVLVIVLVGYGSNDNMQRVWIGGLDGFPFLLQKFSLETTIYNAPIL